MSFLQYMAEQLPEDKRWLLHDKIVMETRLKLYSNLLEFEASFLKPVLKKYGANSTQYTFLSSVKNNIIQAAEQQYIIEKQREHITAITQLNNMLLSENSRLQANLNKYETIEEMSIAGTLNAYVRSVQENLKERELKNKREAVITNG